MGFNSGYKGLRIPLSPVFRQLTKMSNKAVMTFHKFYLPCIFGSSIKNKLRHKPEGRGFDFRWCHWNFLLT